MLHPSGTLTGSVCASTTDAAVLPLPFPRGSARYYDHLIDVLGRLTDYRAGAEHAIPVDMDNVIKPVLKAAGIDPDTHPQVLAGHWKLSGDKGHKDLAYKVGRAHFNLREDTRSGPGLTILAAPMVWGLTEEGVELALQRRREAEANDGWKPLHERNLTREWFVEAGPIFLAEVAQLALSWGLPPNTRDKVSKHLLGLVESDALRDDLARGVTPKVLDTVGEVVPLPKKPKLPTPEPMFDSLIRVLCKRANFKAGVVIAPSEDLYNEVLRDYGIDPQTHPNIVNGIWDLKGKPGLYRQVTHAMKWQADTRKPCSECGAKYQTTETCECGAPLALSNKNSNRFTSYIRTQGKRAQWTLTALGVAHGLALGCPKREKLTTHWLASRSELVCSLPSVVGARFRRLSRERIAKLLDRYLTQLRAENVYGDRLLSGNPPTGDEFVSAAITYVGEESSKSNATAQWFAIDTARKVACIHKRLSSHLAKSRNIGEIDDLVNDYITNAIRLDSITKWMERNPGRNVTDRMVANWALKRAYSKFRDAAKDCHQREFRDARTKDERELYEATWDAEHRAEALAQQHKNAAAHSEALSSTPVHLTKGSEGKDDLYAGPISSSSSAPLVDVVDNLAVSEERIVHNIDRERGFAMLENAVRRQKPGAPDRYVGILNAVFQDDLTTREIAEVEHVRRNRAASLTQDMRNAVRASVADSESAHSILSYVQEEPFSTESDLHDDLGMDYTAVVKLLGWMSESGWLERRFDEAKSKAEAAYLVTKRGEAILRESQDPELRGELLNRFLV